MGVSTREPRSGNLPPPPGSAVSLWPGAVGRGICPWRHTTPESRVEPWGPVVGGPREVPKPYSCPPLEVPARPGDAAAGRIPGKATLLGVGTTPVPSGLGSPRAASPAGVREGSRSPSPRPMRPWSHSLEGRRSWIPGATPSVGFPRVNVAAAEARCSSASSSLAEGRPTWGQEGKIHERLRLVSSVVNGVAGAHSAPRRGAARPTLGAAPSGGAAHGHGNRFTPRDRAEGLPGPTRASHRQRGGQIGTLPTCEWERIAWDSLSPRGCTGFP